MLAKLRHLVRERLDCASQVLRFIGFDVGPISVSVTLFVRLAKDVLDAFEGSRDGEKIWRAEFPSCIFSSLDSTAYVISILGQHGIHYVVAKTANILQIKVQALAEEIIQLLSICILHRCRIQHARQ